MNFWHQSSQKSNRRFHSLQKTTLTFFLLNGFRHLSLSSKNTRKKPQENFRFRFYFTQCSCFIQEVQVDLLNELWRRKRWSPRLKGQRKVSTNDQLPTGPLGRKTKIGFKKSMWIIGNRDIIVRFPPAFLSCVIENVKFRN